MLNTTVDVLRVEGVVVDAILLVLDRPDVSAADITPASRLTADVGLESIDLAQLVAILEVELQADPFREFMPITSVRTVGDLRDAYVRFLRGETADSVGLDEIAVARARAGRRRNS